MAPTIRWQDIAPADAADIDLDRRPDITAPLNDEGSRCPWPWDPQQRVGVPLGQYHLRGAMVVAGVEHFDYREFGAGPGHQPTDGRLDHCACGQSWPCDYADE